MPVFAPVFLVIGCALLVVESVPSERVKRAESEKKLRNVIITSFGELPYDPVEVEHGGFFQADVFPVNLNDEDRQQTMDVALRTRILVEDPNEKKDSVLSAGILVEDPNEKSLNGNEKSSTEEDVTSTNSKRQVSENERSREKQKLVKIDDDDFLSPRVPIGNRKPKVLREKSDKFSSTPRSYGYEFRQTRKQNIPYSPPTTDQNGYNINTEYYGDLGEGWNLQDAEHFLQGRNYNILIKTPNHRNNYPAPSSREIPPPIFHQIMPYPTFYPFPRSDYNPYPHPVLSPNRGPRGYSESEKDYEADTDFYTQTDSNKQSSEGRSLNINYVPSRKNVQDPRVRVVPYTQPVYYDDYLSGI